MLQPPAEDADALIRGLIAHWREPGEAEVRLILNRIARAPFTTRWVRLPHELRQSEYLSYRFGLRAPSPLAHLAKRVLVDRQWRRGTTVEQ
jgi:hypothetical protein